jgi:hypothetical protein
MNYYKLTELTTAQLKTYTEGMTAKQQKDCLEWTEGYLLTSSGCGDYKLELLLENLYTLLAPDPEDTDTTLAEYSEEGEAKYKDWLNSKAMKQAKQQAKTYYTLLEDGTKLYSKENNWSKTSWKQDAQGNKYALETKYKYLPGPMCKENWNPTQWLATKYQ